MWISSKTAALTDRTCLSRLPPAAICDKLTAINNEWDNEFCPVDCGTDTRDPEPADTCGSDQPTGAPKQEEDFNFGF